MEQEQEEVGSFIFWFSLSYTFWFSLLLPFPPPFFACLNFFSSPSADLSLSSVPSSDHHHHEHSHTPGPTQGPTYFPNPAPRSLNRRSDLLFTGDRFGGGDEITFWKIRTRKMATSTTSAVYIHVIEDVINKVREEFVNNGGPGEAVLTELQGLWEMKMIHAGAVLGPSDRPPVPRPGAGAAITPVHDLNVPYEGTEEYETPTAEMLFSPTPMATPMQTPLPGTVDSSMYNIPTGSSDYPTPTPTPNSNEGATGPVDIKPGAAGRPSPYMQPPSPWMNQRPPLGVDVNVAYVEGREDPDRGASLPATQDFLQGPSGKRKREEFASQYPNSGFIPQQDGAGDAASDVFELEIVQSKCSGSNILKVTNGKVTSNQQKGSSSRIPQLDGPIPDPYDDMLSTPNIYNYEGVVNEDYNVVNTPAPDLQAGTPAVPAPNDIPEEDDDDEPPLNENDDDELDDVDQGEELNTQHLVLAQFDKVTRTKSRWKCTLKDGIMHINNKDILFNKATGEFDF